MVVERLLMNENAFLYFISNSFFLFDMIAPYKFSIKGYT